MLNQLALKIDGAGVLGPYWLVLVVSDLCEKDEEVREACCGFLPRWSPLPTPHPVDAKLLEVGVLLR